MSAQSNDPLISVGEIAGLSSVSNNKSNLAEQASLNATYRIVFWGQCINGRRLTDVQCAFAKRFKIFDADQLEQIFSGKIVTLKKGLHEQQADKFINALLELGAIARKESEFRNYFSETEVKQRNKVSFLEQDDFDPDSLSLAPKEELPV